MSYLSENKHLSPRMIMGSSSMLPVITAFLFCLLWQGKVMGVPYSENNNRSNNVYQLDVSKASETFDIPYRELTAGTCYRLVSRDPERWSWNNRTMYDGKIKQGSGNSGYFEAIPLPVDVAPGIYNFDIMVGFTGGGITCYSDPIPLSIRVMGIDGSVQRSMCSGTKIEFTPDCVVSVPSVTDNYHWTRAVVSGIKEGTATGVGGISEVLTNETLKPVSVKYVYTVTPNECSGEGSFEVLVTVNPVVAFEVVNKKTEMCSGETTDIVMSPNGEGVSYRWDAETFGTEGATGGAGDAIRQPIYYEMSPAAALYRISVVLPEGNGCSPQQTTVVRLKELPEIALDWIRPVGTLVVGNPIRFSAYPDNYTSYEFSVNGQVTKQRESELLCYDWIEEENNNVIVSVISENGCRNADTLDITGPKLNLPNVFTPGVEGDNSRFLYNAQLPGFKLEVFNRNGSQLYSGENGWDGRYKGILVPSGTYLYVVHYETPDGQKVIRKYHVYVRTGL